MSPDPIENTCKRYKPPHGRAKKDDKAGMDSQVTSDLPNPMHMDITTAQTYICQIKLRVAQGTYLDT
jgi:hypothetical protein